MSLERDLGMDALRQGDFEAAIEHLERSRRETPGDFQVLFCLSGAYHQTKHDNEAVQVLSEALALRPYDAHVHYNLGICLDRVHRRREAIAALQCALVMQPEYPLARHVLNRWLEAEGRAIQESSGDEAASYAASSSPARPQVSPAPAVLMPRKSEALSASSPSLPPALPISPLSSAPVSPSSAAAKGTDPPAISGRRPRRRGMMLAGRAPESIPPAESLPALNVPSRDLATSNRPQNQGNSLSSLAVSVPGLISPPEPIREAIDSHAVGLPPVLENRSPSQSDGSDPVSAGSSSKVSSKPSTPPGDAPKKPSVWATTVTSNKLPERAAPAGRPDTLQQSVQHLAAEPESPAYMQEGVPCPLAIEALKLAVGSFFLVGLFLGPMAISRGIEARRWIAESPYWTGDGYARAAIVMGVIGIPVSCVELFFLFAKI